MNKSIYRSGRVFHVDDLRVESGGWYFAVRDADSRGPFTTRRLAELALVDYLFHIRDTPRSQGSKLKTRGDTDVL